MQRLGDDLVNDPTLVHASETELDTLTEGLERYLNIKLYGAYGHTRPEMALPLVLRSWSQRGFTSHCVGGRTFAPPEDREADAAMEDRLAGLQFVTRDHLGLPSPAGGRVGDVALSIAETALVRMTEHKTVGPKIDAIVTCCKLILSTRAGLYLPNTHHVRG